MSTESGVHIFNKKKKHTDPSAWRYFSNKSKAFKEEGKTVSVSKILFEGRNIWFGTDKFITAEEPEFNLGGVYIHDRRIDWTGFTNAMDLAVMEYTLSAELAIISGSGFMSSTSRKKLKTVKAFI